MNRTLQALSLATVIAGLGSAAIARTPRVNDNLACRLSGTGAQGTWFATAPADLPRGATLAWSLEERPLSDARPGENLPRQTTPLGHPPATPLHGVIPLPDGMDRNSLVAFARVSNTGPAYNYCDVRIASLPFRPLPPRSTIAPGQRPLPPALRPHG